MPAPFGLPTKAVVMAERIPFLEMVRRRVVVLDGAMGSNLQTRPLDLQRDWLGQENSFPHGAVLLTGTGIVPPDDFTLAVRSSIRPPPSTVVRVSPQSRP